jgi:hypothetical protein
MKKCGILPPNILDPHPFGSGTVPTQVGTGKVPGMTLLTIFGATSKWLLSYFVLGLCFLFACYGTYYIKKLKPLLSAMYIFLGSDPEIYGVNSSKFN